MNIEPIGVIHSCFKQKFGIPRQPGLVPLAKATLELFEGYNSPEMVRGLEAFSHVWLLFEFHATSNNSWKPTVRPPRLGGNQRLGVFATRSMFRPNGLGLSVCKLESVPLSSGVASLELSGVDLLDNTPVLDIKPYLPYADAVENAYGSYATDKPVEQYSVVFSDDALAQCQQLQGDNQAELLPLISQILAQDPRPAFHEDSEREYKMQLYDIDIKWLYSNNQIMVVEVVKVLSIC